MTKFLNVLADFHGEAAVLLLALSIFLLCSAMAAAFAALGRAELDDGRLRITITAVSILYIAYTCAVCPILGCSNPPSDVTVITLGIPLNAIAGIVTSFSYRERRTLEAVVFWVAVGLVLDIAAFLGIDPCNTFYRLYLRC